MKKTAIAAIATLIAASPVFAQTAPPAAAPAKPAASTPAKAAPKAASSTPESRSAEALALSHEPTFDEGTAQRIKEAALSYSDIAVRGGWPTVPTDAKFVAGVAGPNDDLLRKRLIIYESSRIDDTREIWQVRFRGKEAIMDLLNPRLEESQIQDVSNQLGEILNEAL